MTTNTNTTASRPNVTFETTTCGRCGGTGTYPSAAYNGVCLGCSGHKVVLTRAGRAAKKIYDSIVEGMMTPAEDVKVGDRVYAPFAVGMMGSANKWMTVEAIGEPRFSGRSKIGDEDWKDVFVIDFKYVGFEDSEKVTAVSHQAGTRIKVWNADLYVAACVRVAHLKGAIVTGLPEAPASPAKAKAPKVATMSAARSNGSHAACSHPATPKDRAACRKARAAQA